MHLPGTLAFLPSSNTYSESVRMCGPCKVQICLGLQRLQIYIVLGGSVNFSYLVPVPSNMCGCSRVGLIHIYQPEWMY